MRKITPDQLNKIIAAHRKWLYSDGTEGKCADLSNADLHNTDLSNTDLRKANLSSADLSRVNFHNANLSKTKLIKANLSGADLSGVSLFKAELMDTNLSKANLFIANVSGADLSGANLTNTRLTGTEFIKANLSRANLSTASIFSVGLQYANLSGANLYKVDLSSAILHRTKLREEDLIGVTYSPEQLKDMIIERPERKPVMVPEEKCTLTIRFAKEDSPLRHLIYLSTFIEYQYDIFHVLLFHKYESIDKLREILSGSPYHWVNDKETVKIMRMSTQSPLYIELLGQVSVLALIYAIFKAIPNEVTFDFYKCFRQALYRTPEEKLDLANKEADLLAKYHDLIEKGRDVGVAPVNFIPPGKEEETLPQISQGQNPIKLSQTIEEQKDDIANRQPRKDFVQTVLLLRKRKELTNKAGEKELANVLEIIIEKASLNCQSMCKETGNFEVDLKKEDEKKGE